MRQKLEEEELEKELDANYQAFFTEIFRIQSEMRIKSSSYLAPFLTLTNYQTKARSMLLSQLQSQIELAQVELELIDEAIAMLNGGITESIMNHILTHNEVDVAYKRGNLSWGRHLCGLTQWELHKQETLEKIQVLEVGKVWFRKFIDIFKQAIAERESHKGEILERIMRAQKNRRRCRKDYRENPGGRTRLH